MSAQSPKIKGFPLVAPTGRFDLGKWTTHHTPYDPDCAYCVEAEDFADSDQWQKVEKLLIDELEKSAA